METIKIKSVSIQGFRSFVEKQDVNNLPSEGLVGIRGQNLDTGGSSGSGKSSFVNAIAYALGFSPFPASRQQSWHTKKTLQVEVVMETTNGKVLLRRGKETSIQVGNEPKISGSIKAVEERLERLIGIPTDLLKALTYRQQRKSGLFLSLDDSNKKSFLSQLLGLEELEKQIEIANKASQVAAIEVEKHKSTIENFEKILVKPSDFDSSIVIVIGEKEYQENEVEELVSNKIKQIEIFKQRLNDLLNQNKQIRESMLAAGNARQKKAEAEIREFDEYIKSIVQKRPGPPLREEFEKKIFDLESKRQSCQERVSRINKEISDKKQSLNNDSQQLLAKIEDLIKSTARLPGLNKELDLQRRLSEKLRENLCFTCGQSWQNEVRLQEAEKACNDLKKEIELIEEKATLINALKSRRQEIEDEIQSVKNEDLEKLTKILAKIEDDINVEKNAFKNAEDQYFSKIAIEDSKLKAKRIEIYARCSDEKSQQFSSFQEKLDDLQRLINDVNRDLSNEENSRKIILDAIKDTKTEYDRRKIIYEQQLESYKKIKASIDDAIKDLKNSEQRLYSEADFSATLKAFLGSIFDEVLAEISAETNELLLAIPNVATTTVNFTSEKMTQKGIIRQEIKPVITRNGVALDLEANLSGGQLTSVELAIDLAMAAVIGRRTGKRPGWMILDECFEGHDSVVKESCLEILQRASKDCAIFVIDHAVELKEYFVQFINIVSQDDVSRIQ